MKKNVIISVSTFVVIVAASVFFYLKNEKDKRKLIPTQPVAIVELREFLEKKNVNLEGACKTPSALTKDIIDLNDADLKTRFDLLCQDIEISKKLEENFGSNTNYKYFVDCARTHSANIQQIMTDLKEHYSEDYRQVNFSKEEQERILLKYLKHPKAAFLMAQCEAKSEALYWKAIAESGKVEDLKFCLQVTEDCIAGKSKPEECPVNYQAHHDECSKALNKMKH